MSEKRKTAGEDIWDRAIRQAVAPEFPLESVSHLRTMIINAIDELVEDITRDHDAEIEAMEKHYNRLD